MAEKPTYRMSEAGNCPKVLGAMRLNYEPLPETKVSLRIMRESSRHEDFVIEDLTSEGYIITDRQKELTLETPVLILQGHIDGIARNINDDNKPYLLEIKALGRFTFQKYQSKGLSAFPGYEAQVTCYSEATGLPILFVVKNRDTGEIIKTELSETLMSFDDILDKLNMVELCVQDSVLPEATFSDDRDQCQWCHYHYLCIKKGPKKLTKISEPNLLEAAKLWREGKQYEDMAKERIEDSRRTFLNYMKPNAINKCQVEKISISYNERVRQMIDEKKAKEILPAETISQITKEIKYDDLRIREIEEK